MIIVEEVEDGVNQLLSNVSGRRHSLAMVGEEGCQTHSMRITDGRMSLRFTSSYIF
jgi:hypothetical protein